MDSIDDKILDLSHPLVEVAEKAKSEGYIIANHLGCYAQSDTFEHTSAIGFVLPPGCLAAFSGSAGKFVGALSLDANTLASGTGTTRMQGETDNKEYLAALRAKQVSGEPWVLELFGKNYYATLGTLVEEIAKRRHAFLKVRISETKPRKAQNLNR